MSSKLMIAASVVGLSAVLMGGSRTAYAAPPTDACSLLTPAQVGSVLGVSVSAGGPPSPSIKSICGWPAPGGVVPAKRALVNIANVSVFAGAKMGLVGKDEAITSVSGIGDEAFYDAVGRNITLFVRKGDFAVGVKVYGFPSDEIKAKEKALAQDIFEKL